jgi:hypothetical protein
MKCPVDGNDLVKLRMSYVCPACHYKIFQPDKKVYPECGYFVEIPEQFSWSDFTSENITVASNTIVLTSGQVSGSAVSPRLSNINRHNDRSLDVSKIIITRATYTKGDGKIKLYASNDGGTTWLSINDDNQEWNLHDGNEGIAGPEQSLYYDLRIKVSLSRDSADDTTPTFSNITIAHDYKGDHRNTIKRANIDNLMKG